VKPVCLRILFALRLLRIEFRKVCTNTPGRPGLPSRQAAPIL